MLYKGICGCGKVAFEIDGEFAAASSSNRQACPGTNAPLRCIPRGRLRLPATEESIGAYTFNDQVVGHRFCHACGIHLYGEDLGAGQSPMAYVNPECVETVDLAG